MAEERRVAGDLTGLPRRDTAAQVAVVTAEQARAATEERTRRIVEALPEVERRISELDTTGRGLEQRRIKPQQATEEADRRVRALQARAAETGAAVGTSEAEVSGGAKPP